MKIFKREPDHVIGVNYLRRWFIIPKNKWFNIYLHNFKGSDIDRALHDHPWWSISICLKGKVSERYKPVEQFYSPARGKYRKITRWIPYFRPSMMAHRMILDSEEAWTVFITGPRRRAWGFHCKDFKGIWWWRPWQEFLSENTK